MRLSRGVLLCAGDAAHRTVQTKGDLFACCHGSFCFTQVPFQKAGFENSLDGRDIHSHACSYYRYLGNLGGAKHKVNNGTSTARVAQLTEACAKVLPPLKKSKRKRKRKCRRKSTRKYSSVASPRTLLPSPVFVTHIQQWESCGIAATHQ